MKYPIAVFLASTCALAHADGATLITAGPPVPAAVRQQLSQNIRSVVSVQGITLYRNSFGANVLTVVIDGKTHTYVGQMEPFRQKSLTNAWLGKEGDFGHGGSYLSLSRAKDTGDVMGTLWGQDWRYQITSVNGVDVLVKVDYRFGSMREIPTPTMKPIDPAGVKAK